MSKLKMSIFAIIISSSVFLQITAHATEEKLAAGTSATANINRAIFTQSGEALLPAGYRNWVHVGTRINTKGTNILDLKKISRPEILNAYVEPSAYKYFKATGTWADGSQIVKEFTTVKVGEGCNTTTFVCDSKIGQAIFEDNFTGLGMMIKDSKRFSKEIGHWGYFNFGHHAKPYKAKSALQPLTQCAGCHIKGAADKDYVFSDAHISLRKTSEQLSSHLPPR